MATPTFGLLNHTSISTCESITNWNGEDGLDSDFAKEGSNAMGAILTNDLDGYDYDHGSAPATAAAKHFRMWILTTNKAYMDTEAASGYELWMFDASSTQYITIFGSDTYDGGWKNVVIDCELYTSLTLANVEQWGIRVNHHTRAKNLVNCWVDKLCYLDGYYVTGGTSGDKLDLATLAARDVDDGSGTLRGYGIIVLLNGIYFCNGKVNIGNSTTTTYFDMDADVLSFLDEPVASGLYELSAAGTAANITIADSLIQAKGTTDDTRFEMDMSLAASFSMTGTVVQHAAAIEFPSGDTVTGNTFNDCQQITQGGADMSDCVVKNYAGTTDTGAVYVNETTEQSDNMERMQFIKGTTAAHAVQFGSSIPAKVILQDCDFSGYNASDNATDSTFYFDDTSGDFTLELLGCTGNFSYKTAGCNVTITQDTVRAEVIVKDAGTQGFVSGARVLMIASDGTGDLPYNQAISTLTRTASTAYCATLAAHGLVPGDIAYIQGATPADYNGAHVVLTAPISTTFTYAVSSSLSTPAGGTKTVTGGILNDTTNALGEVSDVRSWSLDQPVTGYARKSTTTPLYKSGIVSGTISKTTGLTVPVFLIRDD